MRFSEVLCGYLKLSKALQPSLDKQTNIQAYRLTYGSMDFQELPTVSCRMLGNDLTDFLSPWVMVQLEIFF